MTTMYSKLTKYSKHEFRQAHRKIIDVLNSCDTEEQFVTATHMYDNFRRWIRFWKNKWRQTLVGCPWELSDYFDWFDEMDMLIDDIDVFVQRFYNFIERKHQEEAEQARKETEITHQARIKNACSPKYPKPIVIRGFADPEPKKKTRRKKISPHEQDTSI